MFPLQFLGRITPLVRMTQSCAIVKTMQASCVRHAHSRGQQLSGHRSMCKKDDGLGPRCSKERMKKVGSCEHFEIPPDFNKDCCNNPCPDVMPRFDDLYYKQSDKKKRAYQQTWSECPKLYIAPREVCCYECQGIPPMEYRPNKPRCHGAAPPALVLMMMCRNKGASKCPKIVLPGCCRVRDPPKCIKIRRKTDCKKRCTPYPAFSECDREKPRPLRPVECNCLKPGPVCLANLLYKLYGV